MSDGREGDRGVPAWPVRWSLRVLMLLVYALVSTSVVDVFMTKGALFEGASPEYAFESIVDRTAHRPFAYRVAMPWLLRATDSALPAALRPVAESQGHELVRRYSPLPAERAWRDSHLRAYLYAYLWMHAFALATLFAIRALTASVFPGEPMLRDAGPILFGTLWPLAFMNGGFLYDFPEMMLLATMFALAWTARYRWLAIATVAAVLNKETAVLALPMVALVVAHRDRSRRARVGVLGAVLAGVATLLVVRHMLRDLPGASMWVHASENLAFWTHWRAWFDVMTVQAAKIPFPRGLNLALSVPMAVVLAWGAMRASAALRRLFVLACSITIPLFVLFCWRDETRNLSLAFPAAYLVACEALRAIHGRPRDAS